MYNTSFVKKILLAVIAVFLYSCDKDFNALGDGLVGDDHFGLEAEKYDVVAFNQEVTPIQSNALAINALGIYDNPVFGTTTANFVTQVALAAYAPTIGESPVIESAVLSIPYFSHVTATDATTGDNTYVLDSIYGDQDKGKIDLKVYESGMQMRSSYFSGGSQLPQLYYTDQNTEFESKKLGTLLNDSPDVTDVAKDTNENTKFQFSAKEYKDSITTDGKKSLNRVKPEMRLHLNKDFFQAKILNAASSKLASADVFQEYFRGLYFNVAKSAGSPSSMALLDFTKGKITITYKAKTASTTDDVNATEEKTLVVNLTGATSTASFLQQDKNQAYKDAIDNANINRTEGDERLYINGGQGSVAVIRLSDFASKLATIRENKWKVNEANLVFYIDADKMTGTTEPSRVYLYDLTNNLPVLDYLSDGTSSLNPLDPNGAKYIFGGLITLDSNKRGKFYKIRITDHIRNLIKDTTAKNVDLGLVVSQSVNVSASNALENRIPFPNTDPVEYFSQAPRTSVMNPLGTILYGGKASVSVPEDKRLRLEVYYTKPN